MDMENELPEDVLMEILSRLPAKSLLRFKSVSIHWYSLIRNPNFISLHRTRAQLGLCISLLRAVENDPYHWSMHFLPDQTSIHDLDFSFARPHLNKDFSYQGYCNGLMCLSINSNIVICNPATRECRLIPKPPDHTWPTSHLGFAFDSKTHDYKVVRVVNEECKFQIYSMSADSWKELVITGPYWHFYSVNHHPCTSLDGVFYWLSSSFGDRWSIHVLNTVERSLDKRSLPSGVRPKSRPNICLLKDSLALVVAIYESQQEETTFDVWLMDEYGVKESWTKKYSIGPMLGNRHPFGFLPNGEVLLDGCDDRLIMSYNRSTGDIKEYKQLCILPALRCLSQVFQYSESLVSVGSEPILL